MKCLIKKCFALTAFLMLSVMAFAQNRTVSGVVSSTNGEALIGAGVVIKGTTTGTVTDLDGRYSISVPANAVLQFTSVGYKTLDVNTGNKTKVDVILEDDSQLLEEAVAIGYGNQRKLTLTGSVTSTSGKELVKNSSVNLSQGLAGRLSGVVVNNRSGEPGHDDAVMYIRGRSTLGDNTPLIVIDGVIGRSDEFSRLSGEEIESINVLKDASAAIYGARSANGVILVTTKRGKFNEAPNVTFTYDLGLQQPTRLVEMADAVLFTHAYNDELAITGAAPKYNQTQLAHYESGDDPVMYPNTNWFKEIIKPVSQQHKYGVSVDGGGDRVGYFVQFNGQYQDGIYYKSATNYQQYNIRSNVDIKVTNNFKLGVDLNVRQQHKNYSAYPSNSTGIFYMATRLKPTGGAYYPNGLIRGGSNPAVLVQDLTGYDKTILNTINATLTADIDLKKVTPGLKINGKLAYDVRNNFNKKWQKNWTYYKYNEITELYTPETMNSVTSPVLRESQTGVHQWTINANINYDRDFNGHHVTGLLGYEQYGYRKDYFKAGITQFDSDILDELFAGSADKTWYSIDGNAAEKARMSFFGRLGYDYNSKYLFQFIARYDGSENFAKGHRWGFFPGVSAGWRMSEESFVKDNAPWLTNLKLRFSYGEQGNDQIDPFQYMTTYEYASAVSYRVKFGDQNVQKIIPGTIPNEGVTWEVAKTWNVGLDGNIFNGKLSWELEYFHTRRSNILCTRNASIPYYSGLTYDLPDENIGIVSNRGIEIQLSHENRVCNGDLIYRINGNFLFARNRVEYMDETPWGEGHEYMALTGHPMGSGLYYQVAGINKTQADLDSHPQMSGATLGDFYFEDLDGDGQITTFDRKRCDLTVVPEIVYGLTASLSWKNLDFSMLFQGQARARFYYAPQVDPVSYNVEANAARNAWTLNNTDADYPRLGSNVSNGGVTSSSFYYRNAAFLRLKNVELGYTLPQSLFGPKGIIKGIRFNIGGYNLYTFSELKTIDPEQSDTSYATYPQVRIFNFGAKFMF
ncbi:MAG: TonB-dependent receptor [Bacteroidales bacterium]|nr:TonB-dependent receptor [Bacteroidales bacterium]